MRTFPQIPIVAFYLFFNLFRPHLIPASIIRNPFDLEWDAIPKKLCILQKGLIACDYYLMNLL